MRYPRGALALLALALAGCAGGGAARPEREVRREAKMDAARPRKIIRLDTIAVMGKPLWAVQPFAAALDWLGAAPEPELAEQPWGERLAEAVERALESRSERAQVVPEKLTDSDMEELHRQGLRYLVGGRLLAAGPARGARGEVALSALYRLSRKLDSGMKVIQARRVEVRARGGLDSAAMTALIEAAAAEIAGHALSDIPADLLAQRG